MATRQHQGNLVCLLSQPVAGKEGVKEGHLFGWPQLLKVVNIWRRYEEEDIALLCILYVTKFLAMTCEKSRLHVRTNADRIAVEKNEVLHVQFQVVAAVGSRYLVTIMLCGKSDSAD